MTAKEKILYHQVHPAKLAADIGAEIVSLWLLWDGWLVWGLIAHFAPAFIASGVLIRFGDFEATKNSPLGRYLDRYMTPAAQGARLAADLAMVAAAWFHQPIVIALGVAVVVTAWSYGLVRPKTV